MKKLSVVIIVISLASVILCSPARTDNTSKPYANVSIDAEAKGKPYSPLIFGGFIEHFHHQIYGGLFDPDSHLSDDNGFRKDVIEAMKELKISIVR